MLELARGVALGVDIGDLLHLERALERDGPVGVAADEEEGRGLVVFFRERRDAVV